MDSGLTEIIVKFRSRKFACLATRQTLRVESAMIQGLRYRLTLRSEARVAKSGGDYRSLSFR
jgi:hypothetical protein